MYHSSFAESVEFGHELSEAIALRRVHHLVDLGPFEVALDAVGQRLVHPLRFESRRTVLDDRMAEEPGRTLIFVLDRPFEDPCDIALTE